MFIPDEDILTLSMADEEKFLVNAPAKSLSLYTHDLAKSCVYNDKDLAGALTKNFSSSAIDSVKISSSGMNTDIHASSDYRANMVKAFAKKAVDAC